MSQQVKGKGSLQLGSWHRQHVSEVLLSQKVAEQYVWHKHALS